MAFIVDKYGQYSMTHRDNASDRRVISGVLVGNSYGFPSNLDGQIVIDIGGHIGSSAVRCAASGAKVHSFEPEQTNYKLLVENSKPYNITCHNIAVGTPGKRNIYLDSNNTGANSMFNNYCGECQVVKTISFAEAFELAGGCDLLKLDCEGAEIEILPEVLKYNIPTVYAEIHWGMGFDEELHRLVGLLDAVYTRYSMSPYEFKWSK